jgi:uncharacterized protein (TIGR03435 family)
MLFSMRANVLVMCLAVSSSMAFGQTPETARVFDVASVRPSQRLVGPDYNNQLRYSSAGFTGRNVTLKRLLAEAYRLQLNQIQGPGWLDQNEYDVEARTTRAVDKGEVAMMLQRLLADRFKLKEHSEKRDMRVYELVISASGAKVHPVEEAEMTTPQPGFHFRGEMRQFADLLAVQFSIPVPEDPTVPSRASGEPIPVVDQTGLSGVFEFSVNIRPEVGADMFALWQRALKDQLGLNLESRSLGLPIIVVDEASKTPTEN